MRDPGSPPSLFRHHSSRFAPTPARPVRASGASSAAVRSPTPRGPPPHPLTSQASALHAEHCPASPTQGRLRAHPSRARSLPPQPHANKPPRRHDTPETHSGPRRHKPINTQPHADTAHTGAVPQPSINNRTQTTPRRHRITPCPGDPEAHSQARRRPPSPVIFTRKTDQKHTATLIHTRAQARSQELIHGLVSHWENIKAFLPPSPSMSSCARGGARTKDTNPHPHLPPGL